MKKYMHTTFFILILSVHTIGQRTILHSARIIDGENKTVSKNKSIIIEGNRIVSIEDGFIIGKGNDDVVNLKNHTVLPGLIDMHVHIEFQTSPDQYLKRFTQNPSDVAYNAATYAKRTLLSGFTTIRDLGGIGVNLSLRDAINKGKVIGPRILTAGRALAVTGGHADPTNGYNRQLVGNPGPKEGVVNGIADAREGVRWRYKNNADWIKITSTGGVLSVAKDGTGPHFMEDEIITIVKTADDLGMQVAAHAHGVEGMKRAVRSGVRTIEHGTYMDAFTMDLMIDYNCYLIPTISAGKFVSKLAEKKGFFPDVVAGKAKVTGAQIQETFKKAYEKGVPIGFGTDAGVFPHGENWKELIYMNEVGMPAMEAIVTATAVNAMLLEMGDQIGKIKKGFLADIIAVEGDPLKDLYKLGTVNFVMKEGMVYKNN